MRKKTVFTVMYYDSRNSGPACDYHHLARFRAEKAAADFAAVNQCYGKPARVECDKVPAQIADRWSYAG